MSWDKEALIAEVKTYSDDHQFSYRELAERYRVTNKSGQIASNGGQIVKELLIRR